jgi:Carboxypeptidase regulatory-like domain
MISHLTHLNRFIGRISAAFALLLICACVAAWCQEVTATINGVVTDPSGGAVAGAKVTAKDLDRGTAFPTTTDNSGFYNLLQLPVGRYEVRVENAGFQSSVQTPVVLQLNQAAKIDFQLKVGNVNQTVEVTTAAPILQTEDTELGTVIDSRAIVSIPLETRNYNQLALLTPGAVTTSPAAFNYPQTTFNSGRPYINGNREQATYYLLDGLENIEFVDNNVAFSPNVDAIQEFNVITQNPSAQFGQFLGGVISVSTKAGTNSYHGDLFEFLRNNVLNANEWGSNLTGSPKAVLRWNEFGGTFGGPAIKDKLFFFVDYQGSRYDTPGSPGKIATFSTLEASQPGNFSDVPGIALHYPGTTIPIPGNNLNNATQCASAQQMALNSTSATPCVFISPLAVKLMGAFPAATLPGTVNNAVNVQHSYINGDQGDARVDWTATDKDHIFGRYSQQYVFNPTTNSQALLYNSSGNNIFPLHQGVLDWTHTFSPTFVNDVRAGTNYFPAEGNVQSASSTNFGSLIPGEPTAFLPEFSFSGAQLGTYGTVDAPEIFHQTSIQAEDTAIITRGTHTFHTGFQFIRYRNDYVPATSNDGAAGSFQFNGNYTGNAEADFLLGLPSYVGLGIGFNGTVGQRNDAIGAFFQDDWRVNSHLTVNLGLRWQLFTPIYEVGNRMTNFNEITGQIELAGQDGNSRALYNEYNGIANFLPRAGIAWSVNDKTVIRTAFSRSSFQEGTGEYNRLATNAPWNNDLSVQLVPGTNGAIPANQVYLDQGFNGLFAAQTGAPCNVSTVTSAPASCFAGVRLHLQDPNYRPAVSNQWNFTVQRQLTSSTTIQAAYVGQHNDHLASILDAGQKLLLPDGSVVQGPYLSGNPTLLADGPGQIRLNATVGIANYNALQVSAQQRLSRGLDFLMNYTWSKCLTNNQGYYGRYGDITPNQASADVAFQQNVYAINADYGLCDHDVEHDFNGFLTYDLPFGRHRAYGSNVNGAVNAILGDWQVNTAFTVHGGFPISMLDWAGDPGTGSFQPRPDCVSPTRATPYQEAPASVGGGYYWFDPTTMANPPAGQFGNCGVSTERGPGLAQVDIGLSKFFPITEKSNLEFRAEAINAFNTPIFTVAGYSIDVVGFNPNGSVATPNTGLVNTSQGARNLQFGLKYNF